MLEWMKDPELRGRVQVGLNKGEARNALASAVFFNRQGELRDRSFTNQCYRQRTQPDRRHHHTL
jgi:TnpA family transposase